MGGQGYDFYWAIITEAINLHISVRPAPIVG